MTRRNWNAEEDRLLVEIVNEASSKEEALGNATAQLNRTPFACSSRLEILRKRGVEIKRFRTPSRIIEEYAKEIGKELKKNPNNIAGTIRDISERTNISSKVLESAWYRHKNHLTDTRGNRMIFFSLMGDKSHPNAKVVRKNAHPKRTKGLWERLIQALRG